MAMKRNVPIKKRGYRKGQIAMSKNQYSEELRKKEEELSEKDDSSQVPPSDIIAFNELRSCADLLRMYKTDQLIIKPNFQRDVVWSKAAQTRFIDSLVKQLPIPSMCLSLDYKTGERLMIDGLQRVSSIISFLTDKKWKLSKLDDIDKRISGRTPSQIKEKNYDIYSRLENLTIPVTVLRCDYSKKSHISYLFTIFHRLNTGGNKLNNQEIRNCIFQGSFNDFLKSMADYSMFIKLMKIDKNKSYRLAYEELILRFFAFYDGYGKYNGRLATFLNDYMNKKKDADDAELSEKRHIFERTVDLLYQRMLGNKPLPKLSKATTESIFVGIAKNLNTLEDNSDKEVRAKFLKLRKNEAFSTENLKEGLSRKENVIKRIETAADILS